MPRLLTAEQVGQRLQLPKTWIYAAARRGELPCVSAGRYRRLDWADVEAWIARKKQGDQ
jgi:excisionase family DNA binding protein